MKKQKYYVFFDSILLDYQNYFGEDSESELIKELKNHLEDLSKTSEINLITKQDIQKVIDWFLKNDLYKFVDNISSPIF